MKIALKIQQTVLWLNQHKAITLLLTVLYSVGILFFHDSLVNVSVLVMNKMGLAGYNLFISILALISFLIIALFLVFQLKNSTQHTKLKIVLIIVISVILALHYLFLLEMNIEIIHAFAYAGLVFLLYSLTLRYAAAIIFSLPVMLIDEWYQYIILYPHYVEYWELNDILLDLLGGAFLLIILFISNVKHSIKKVFYMRSEFILGIILILFFSIAVATCFFATHQSLQCQNTQFVMSKMAHPHTGWHIHGFTQKKYYILSASLSLMLFSVIGVAFLFLDNYLAKNKL